MKLFGKDNDSPERNNDSTPGQSGTAIGPTAAVKGNQPKGTFIGSGITITGDLTGKDDIAWSLPVPGAQSAYH